MLKDYLNWVQPGDQVVVADFDNQRFFSRPLTNIEKAYMIGAKMTSEMVATWNADKRSRAVKKFRSAVS